MTIRLTIKLFGTLSARVPDYNHQTGICVDAPDDATPEDLLNDLSIPLSHIGIISDGRHFLQKDCGLNEGMTISFFSLVSGG